MKWLKRTAVGLLILTTISAFSPHVYASDGSQGWGSCNDRDNRPGCG